MSKQVYEDHRARADSAICDALDATDSAAEKAAILQAYRDALAGFEVPAPLDTAAPDPGDASADDAEPAKAKKPKLAVVSPAVDAAYELPPAPAVSDTHTEVTA